MVSCVPSSGASLLIEVASDALTYSEGSDTSNDATGSITDIVFSLRSTAQTAAIVAAATDLTYNIKAIIY
jgi:hypothetical protein